MPVEDLPIGWERSETFNRIPFYLDHNNGVTQWDHPAVSKTYREFAGLEYLDKIMYAAYRTAMKIRLIQSMSNMHMIDVQHIIDANRKLDIDIEMLSVSNVEMLLMELFSECVAAEKQQYSVELTLNILLKCLDSGRTGLLDSSAVFAVLIVLSCGSPAAKYSALFNIFASAEGELIRKGMHLLLSSVLSIPKCIGESEYFGVSSKSVAVSKCITQEGGFVTEEEFLNWMNVDPPATVWLTTLNRLAIAESVKHEAKCNICKSFPIVGLRFRCLKCLNIDLCQNCFLTNKGNRTHKFSHPIKEYCLSTKSTDDFKDFAKQLKNKITRRYRNAYQGGRVPRFTTDHAIASRSICNLTEVHKSLKSLAGRLDGLASGSTDVLQHERNDENHRLVNSKIPQSESIAIQSANPLHCIMSTAEYLDKGISVSTLDEFAMGDEDGLLQRMTEQVLSVFDSEGIGQAEHDEHVLLQLSKTVSEDCRVMCDLLTTQ